jgi:hypothetical protein
MPWFGLRAMRNRPPMIGSGQSPSLLSVVLNATVA